MRGTIFLSLFIFINMDFQEIIDDFLAQQEENTMLILLQVM